MSQTLFEKIIARQIPARIVYEDDVVLAMHDINPQAPVHVLIVPKKPIPRIAEAGPEDHQALGHLLLKAAEVAAKLGVDENTPGAKIDLGIAGVGGFEGVVLRVPNVTFKTPERTEVFPQVVSIDFKQISKMIGTEVAGVVGFDFFENYKLTLDYYGAEVRLSK